MQKILRDFYLKNIKQFVPKSFFHFYHHSLKRIAYAALPTGSLNPDNDLVKYFQSNKKNLIHKWDHYFDIYDRYFSQYRGKDIVLLEIGVYHGGSLQMWKHYFGDKVKIYAVDINPECKKFEEEGIKIFIGSQEDPQFLESLKKEIPKVDILIDDGGHTMRQQIVTFEKMYDHVKENGVYLCEDTHTSYWKEYQGGYKKEGTFMEYSKNFIDALNAWHSEDENSFPVTDFTRTARSVHFYDSIVVIEKGSHEKPAHHMTGNPTLSHE